MPSLFAYNFIVLGLYLSILIIFIIFLRLAGSKSKSGFFSFLNAVFHIHAISNNDREIILDVYGNRMNFSTNRKLRIAIRIGVISSMYMMALIFVDGCIVSRNVLVSTDVCPMKTAMDCFHFQSVFDVSANPFFCPSNEVISTTNVTAHLLTCYKWEIKSQSLTNILSQMGICSSIVSLLGLLFKYLYLLAYRKYWGTILTVILGLSIIISPIVVWMTLGPLLSYIFFALLTTTIILIINALFLVYTVYKSKNQIIAPQSITKVSKNIEL
ncbi:unnamed protein product [Adineta steineri]|uniref:Uncharacterized protein n=1 Tax=Adineta steineri TaxID=433720 RepID=A0A814EWB3_9BILA|nr:unnamed protein product [Adineta steineri]CAF1259455.1 unnamed protein product [Adineta steineri]